MKAMLFLVTSLMFNVLSCGSEKDGDSPEATDIQNPSLIQPQKQSVDQPSDDSAVTSKDGLFGLNTDHMLEFFDSGDYRFYIKDSESDSYFIEQGTFTESDSNILITPSYTTCMDEGTKFEVKSYVFARSDLGNVLIEGLEFPRIQNFAIESVTEAKCPEVSGENTNTVQ